MPAEGCAPRRHVAPGLETRTLDMHARGEGPFLLGGDIQHEGNAFAVYHGSIRPELLTGQEKEKERKWSMGFHVLIGKGPRALASF